MVGMGEEEKIEMIEMNGMVWECRRLDYYVQLCRGAGKRVKDFLSLETTKELVGVLEKEVGVPVVESRGGKGDRKGIWLHPDLAVELARWISPSLSARVGRWIRGLVAGGLEFDVARFREQEKQLSIKEERIKRLEEVCLAKKRRMEYPEQNVIYMVTTDDHLTRRTYIIGKAKNLTTRLSTYNKTCDHIVVYYRECKSEDDMNTAETLILNKLRDYREQSNRDRFVLPENESVDFFKKMIDGCIDFL